MRRKGLMCWLKGLGGIGEFLFFLGVLSLPALAQISIVREGRPMTKIVLGEKATDVEKHAADELQKYVREISGAKLNLIRENKIGLSRNRSFIIIGTPASSRLINSWKEMLKISEIKYDGFVIKEMHYRNNRFLVFASSEPRGTLYAVYDFLENELGVGFFWQEDRIPHRKNISVREQLERQSSPYFKYREYLQGCALTYSWMKYWDFEKWKKEIDWAAKHKFNMLWYPGGGSIVVKRVYKRLGVDLGKPTQEEIEKSRLARQIINYARSIGMKVVGGGFSGRVKEVLKKVYPGAKYMGIRWLNLPPRLYLDPSDPLFEKIGQYFIEEYTKEYGTDHFYDVGAYGEVNPGASREEKTKLQVNFARAVSSYIRKADPKGIWHMSGWTFQNSRFWTPESIRLFLAAIPDDMYLVNDVYADTRPKYKELNYFWGKNW